MDFFKVDSRIKSVSDKALVKAEKTFKEIEKVTEYNQQKVLSAFINNGVAETHFVPSTGYGYNDRGREVLEQVFAECVG